MRILAVVVRYKMSLEKSQTLQSLCRAFVQSPSLASQIHVVLWDNSPEPLASPKLSIPFEYHHTGENLGVSGAYNRAMEIADQQAIPWMLTLDQDTTLDTMFFEKMLTLGAKLEVDTGVGSIVPFVRSHGRLVSPRRLGRLNSTSQVERRFSGVLHADAYAINSASLIRVAALREIGGYSEEFWLDLSDVYAFQRMRERGRFMYVTGDLEIEHSIAGINFEHDMVPERYRAFLAAENLYLARYSSFSENALQNCRLLLRAARQYVSYRDKRYAAITWSFFLGRLFQPRTVLMREWRMFLLQRRNIPVATPPSSAFSPEQSA